MATHRTRDELEATLAARRELGAEHEHELIQSFLDRVEHQLAERAPARPPAQRQADWSLFALIVATVGAGVSLTEKAVALGGGLGLVAVLGIWSAIVALNAIYSQR